MQAMTDEPIRIATLSDYRRHGYSLFAWCETCQTAREAPLDALIDRYGPEHQVQFGLALRCAVCHGTQVSVTVAAPSGYQRL